MLVRYGFKERLRALGTAIPVFRISRGGVYFCFLRYVRM